MYGVYYFAGAFLTAIAAVAVLLPLDLQHAPTPAHRPGIRHDVGKLLFAFAAFWAYIWYCQYMLIWYADIPEEATYFALRQSSPWVALFWLNPILNFGVPFVLLLSAAAKQRPRLLQHVALIVLLGRWLDVYLLVAPPVDPDGGMAIGAIGASLALFAGMALLYPPSRSSAVEAVPQEAAGRALLAD